MNQEELNKVLELHKNWLNDEEGGVRADLEGADLYRADLRGADLRYASLRGADLRYADLRGADLCEVNLRGADLRGADLAAANLEEADLYSANHGANLHGATLEEAKHYYSFVAYDTSKRIVHCIKHKDTWMIKAGCFWGTLEELETKVKETHNSKVYLANIEILKGLI
jgi:uncharacterized protein YjbI with pentapeptide repeats